MRIAIAADHGGYEMKEYIKLRLQAQGHIVEDYGVHNTKPADYADVGRPAARAVAHGKADRAVLIDTVGIAMCMVANRLSFVRAAMCDNPHTAAMAREHNDANVLCLGGGMIGRQMADSVLKAFLETEFGGGRHQRRVDKIEP